jgi:acyl-CoA reductase-like NAD-dependent aldehyde dehydrogenase
MNDVEKARFNAALDLIQWFDQRIAQQVEHQVEQRLAQEREYWSRNVVDLLATERQHLIALIAEERRAIIDWVKAEVVGLVERDHDRFQNMIAKANEAVERTFDWLEARFGRFVPMDRSDDDGQPPPSKH